MVRVSLDPPQPLPLERPRIAPALARRIDRLARYAHRWHRHAHHPLCARYAGELVQLGRRTRVCRGCALALGGTLFGLGAGAGVSELWPLRLGAAQTWLVVALLVLVVAAAAAVSLHARRKLFTRGLPAFVLAAAFAFGLRRADLAGSALAAGAALGVASAWIAYRRRGPDRSACTDCPEGPPHAGCSGFAPIVQRERAFQRLVSRWLANS